MMTIKDLINNPKSLTTKIITILIFILIFTSFDLIIKQVAYKNLRNKPDVVVIPGFWSHHFEINDDIGFSALRWVDKYFGLPKQINANIFENKILKNIENDYQKNILIQYYTKDEKTNSYNIKQNISDYEKYMIKRILSSSGLKTSKWLFLVILQGLGTIAVIAFFFYSNFWRYLLPLGLIVSGALGNVTDRIIRGYVVDYVMWTIKFIPLPIFNPWPIFNLADTYTVVGAISLFIVLFFFSKEEPKKVDNK